MPPLTEDEIKAAIINFLYSKGKYYELTLSQIFKYCFGIEEDINKREGEYLINELVNTLFVEILKGNPAHYPPSPDILRLSPRAIIEFKKHETYEKYIIQERKSKRINKLKNVGASIFKWVKKNVIKLIGIAISAAITVYITAIMSRGCTKDTPQNTTPSMQPIQQTKDSAVKSP